MSLKIKLNDKVKEHLVNTTALVSVMNPIYSGVEVSYFEMSDELSINAKLLGTAIGYFGLGTLIMKGRDFSKKIFGIKDDTNDLKIGLLHDTPYLMIANGIISPLVYMVSELFIPGQNNLDFDSLKKISLVAGVIGGVSGYGVGYLGDTFLDLVGIKECNRGSYPNFIKNQSSKIKKGLVGLVVASSLAVMVGIYTHSEDKIDYFNKGTIEERVELESTNYK